MWPVFVLLTVHCVNLSAQTPLLEKVGAASLGSTFCIVTVSIHTRLVIK